MALVRRNSLPTEPTTLADLPTRQGSAPVHAPPDLAARITQLAHLQTQASALDELNRVFRVRTLEQKLTETEASVKLLCQRTADDAEYRSKNEQRVTELFRELLAVKQQIQHVEDAPVVSEGDVKDGVKRVLEPLGVEIEEDRAIVRQAEEISAGLPGPEDIEEIMKQNAHLLQRNSQLEGQISRRFHREDSQQSSASESELDPDIRRRINETIGSTRRWNAQHANTQLEEPIFVKSFLEKQGSRDMPMAQIIHRALGRLLTERDMAPSSCRDLAEFCEKLVWKDVIFTIKKLFGPQKTDTVRKLARWKQK